MERPQRLARKAERMTAERHGTRLNPQSGSGSVKNDSRNKTWSVEDKSTSGLTYTLHKDTLLVAERQALADGRRMKLVVTFFGQATPPKRYVVLTEEDHLETEAMLEDLEDRLALAHDELDRLREA